MKRARRILVVAAACAAAVVVVAVFWARNREPEYKGKNLSEWIRSYRGARYARATYDPVGGERRMSEAREGVREIGTNALPFLLEWIKREPARWKQVLLVKYCNLPPRFQSARVVYWLGDGFRQGDAVAGLEILGENAGAAVPELRRLANVGGAGWSSAVEALAFMGKDGERVILEAATNGATAQKRWLIPRLGDGLLGGNGRNEVISVMVWSLGDKDVEVRARAARYLGDMREDFPAGGASFEAAEARAESALRKALDDEDPKVRKAAHDALERLTLAVLRAGAPKEGNR